ncbi:MAG: MlaD family protein [Bacteroidales bacterium]|nr:MlaD family protein [Bacteroidales bacterium]MDD2611796.1 MlaD family protein [Bacteroidales bacterium]MDD4712217.1 MlaD family protein [Bacteroidales bacterium]
MKSEIKSEAKIGLIVILTFSIFVWGLNYLKGVNLLSPSNHFYVTYNKIDGLVKSSPVNLDGYQVGLVRDIQYQYDNPGHILVDLDLNSKLRLPKGTKAIIKSEMLGNPTIVLELGPQNAEMLQSGDTLIAENTPGMMDQLSDGLLTDMRNMIHRTDSLVASIDVLVSNGSLDKSLTSIEKTTKELEQISAKLNHSMDKQIPSILNNVETLTAKFSDAGTKINQLDFASLNKTINQLENLSVKLNSPDNSMGLLLNDQSLYLNLSNTAQSANTLLLDLKERPKRYVHFSIFGSKESK